jgi:hypothetical protein
MASLCENGDRWQVDDVLTDFSKAFNRVLEVLFVNFFLWLAFVLDGVLYNGSNTLCKFNVIPRPRRRATSYQYSSFWILTGPWTSLKI